MTARVGVVLSGCGFLDGAEIQEAVSVLVALDRCGAKAICFAPDVPQMHHVDHLAKHPTGETRNVLRESARIARGAIRDLKDAHAGELDALILPGGFGAAKNLSTFAVDGPHCKVNGDVERILREMHAAKKPIGLACIAPVIAARVFGASDLHPSVTIGTDPGTARAIEAMGGRHQDTGPSDIHVDEKNRLVTTPCYMNDVGPWIVFQGADAMVEKVLAMAGKS